MKKSLLFAALAVSIAAACTKTGQVTQTPDPLDDGQPVPVIFSASAPRNIEVKSTGAALSQWSGQQLNVYSYEAGVNNYAAATAFIDNSF